MPLFQFARLNRIPMIALNVDRSLVARVGKEGWEAVPPSEREGLSDPAPASPAYQRELARVYLMKKSMPREAAESSQVPNMPEPDEAALAEAMKEPEFKRFVQAQLTWDRAMAEALASATRKFPNATIVGVLGSGHVEHGHGVPHQLKDLGVTVLTALIPVSVDTACKLVGTSYADAVFTLPRSKETPTPTRPRLGVLLMQGDGAPRINRVVSGSVAEAAGLQAGDHVVRAAGLETRNPDDLVEIVGRQAPGTWLPLGIRRDGQEIDLIAKFPTLPRQD
jgi:membrane-associated protease RseP (regulator of RpoE activity)